MQPVADRHPPNISRSVQTVNTASMTVLLSFLGRNVLGQYDPLLLTDETSHGLYFVHPNILAVATELDVSVDRFRRWIVFHEVTHAAEFGTAPWLTEYLEQQIHDGIDNLLAGEFRTDQFRELDATMTAVEGYAELLMDHAFDQEYEDLRQKLDERRRRTGPVGYLVRRLFGLDMKRRQYERGKRFFESVAANYDLATASMVWESPENLPDWNEFETPDAWVNRIQN